MMNFSFLFFLFGILQLNLRKGYGSSPPLTILTNQQDDKFELSDLEVIQHKNLFIPGESRMLLCCTQTLQSNIFIIEEKHDNVEEHTITCPNPWVPSVVKKPGLETYEIGYEILDQNDILHILDENDKKPEKRIWLEGITVDFDTPEAAVKGSFHYVHPNRHSSGDPSICLDFHIGQELFNGLQLDLLYDQTIQRDNFANFIIKPSHQSLMADTSPLLENEYLVPHQLTPIDDFDADSLRLTTCSYLNTVPIWKSISKGSLKKVEYYIRVVADVIGGISILTGTYGILQLPFNTGSSKMTTQQMYLDTRNKNIPIPRILFKMISYGIQTDDDIEPTHFAIIIITHNEFTELDATTRLCSNVCSKYGWYVANSNTYCCEPTEYILDRFHIKSLPNLHPFNLHQSGIVLNNEVVFMDLAAQPDRSNYGIDEGNLVAI